MTILPELDPDGMEAARKKGREIAGNQPGALIEAFAEVAAAGAAAYLSAARSVPEAGKAVVKPLEWREPSSKNNQCWTADSPLGTYSVVNEDGWYACRDEAPRDFWFEWSWRDMSRDNLLTAQAACQADYEQRILSALASVPAPSGAIERNTHLLDWLNDGWTHCQHGTREWCEGYLHNARDVNLAPPSPTTSAADALWRQPMSFIPYHSPKGTVDVTVADEGFRAALEAKLDHMRRITIRWVPVMQEISRMRPDAHWCSYDDGKTVIFLTLGTEESFGDLESIYDMIGRHVRHLESLGNYTGKFVADPDPEDDTNAGWRTWTFQAGNDSRFQVNASFYLSRHCRIVTDGTETITVEKKRVQCGETAEDLASAA